MKVLKINFEKALFISMFAVAAFLFFCCPVNAAQYGDFTYSISNGQTQITKYTGGGGAVDIPEKLGNYPVTSIGDLAFSGCSNISSVKLPSSLKSIGYLAFQGCSNMSTINLPEGLNSIGISAFVSCTSLTAITIPGSLTIMGDAAFSGCTSLQSVDIKNGVTAISNNNFSSCINLTNISLPDSLKAIEFRAFQSCKALRNIVIPAHVDKIAEGVFEYCDTMESIKFMSSTTSIFDKSSTIPKRVKIIAYDSSTAKAYASKYGLAFEAINSAPLPGAVSVSVKSTIYQNENVVINWTPATNATNYFVAIGNKNYYSGYNTTGLTYDFGKLPIGNYIVTVTPYNGGKAGPTSSGVSFAVVKLPVPGKATITTDKATYGNKESVIVRSGAQYASKINIAVWTLNSKSAPAAKVYDKTISGGSVEANIGTLNPGNYKIIAKPENTSGAGPTATIQITVNKQPDATTLQFPCKPYPENGRWIGSNYSDLINNLYGHIGVDYRAVDLNLPGLKDKDKPVFAVADGTVVYYSAAYGELIIKHTTPLTLMGDAPKTYHTWYSKYAHMTSIPNELRKVGAKVSAAKYYNDNVHKNTNLGIISYVGVDPGNDHLHFSLFTAYTGNEGSPANNGYTISPCWVKGLAEAATYDTFLEKDGSIDKVAWDRLKLESIGDAPASN